MEFNQLMRMRIFIDYLSTNNFSLTMLSIVLSTTAVLKEVTPNPISLYTEYMQTFTCVDATLTQKKS